MEDRDASIQSDRPTTQDLLSFAPYRDTLVEVIRTAETPLTIGIFGSWGSGKTSLLRMLQSTLTKAGRKPKARVVWFNAWQYNKEEALWRALLSRVLEALRPPNPPRGSKPTKVAEELRRQLDDLQASLYRDVDREETGSLEVDWKQLGVGGLKGAVKFGLSFVPGMTLLADLKTAAEKEGEPWAKDILHAFQREKTRVQLAHVQFLEQFREQFETLVRRHVVEKGERLVVLVDDLDRCLPEKAVEVLEATKLFLDVEGCIFVIAVDHEVIAKGIRVHYRDFALQNGDKDELPISGEDYLEKIIQLPFRLPPISHEDIVRFIEKRASDLPAACAEVFAFGIESNPRKLKRTLNVFWMHSQLAKRRKDLKDLIQPVRLAKVVVIQNHFPRFYRDWVDAPLLLRYLEERFLEEEKLQAAEQTPEWQPPVMEIEAEKGGKTEPKGRIQLSLQLDSELVQKWARLRPLREMLLCHGGEEGLGFAGMEQSDIEAYIYLSRTGTVASVETERRVDERIWEDLLSNDQTRVESAAGRVRDEEKTNYARRLLGVIRPGTEHPPVARVSAGTALSFLADPRFRAEAWYLPDEPMLGFVEVKAGPFSMGSDSEKDPGAGGSENPSHQVSLQSFYMARYPTTVAQFRAFVKESGYQPKDEDSLKGLPNHPVVWVTWHDACAYCDWLTEQLRRWPDTPAGLLKNQGWRIGLPSEAEWEKAARGADGRAFPWGNEPDPARANYDHTEIGRTSAVGCFPGGASPFGVHDLSGNVWEWTRSHLKDYPYDPEDGREDLETGDDVARVLRGGAYFFSDWYVRCAYRYRNHPYYGYVDVGFRVVSSPSGGT